jgi:hypothetical protein
MKYLFAAIAAVLLVSCVTPRPPYEIDTTRYADVIARDAASPGDLIRKPAIQAFETDYFFADRHKAIAQSVNGNWGWSQGQPTPEAAIDRALEACRENNRSRQAEAPCKLVIVDVYWAAEFF